jgi:hypothetical protein
MISSSINVAKFFSQYTRNKHEYSHTLRNDIKLNLLLCLLVLLVRLTKLAKRQNSVFTVQTRTNSHNVPTAMSEADDVLQLFMRVARQSFTAMCARTCSPFTALPKLI